MSGGHRPVASLERRYLVEKTKIALERHLATIEMEEMIEREKDAGLPEERLQALRAAFDATMKDKDFLADAQKLDLEVRPVSGLEIDALVANLARTPADIRKLAVEASASVP